MEIARQPTTQERKDAEWENLIRVISEEKDSKTKRDILDMIDRRRKTEAAAKKYQERVALASQMEKIRKTAPHSALKIMMDLQIALDDEDIEKANSIMFDVDNTENLMEVIADLIFVCNHSEIQKVKKFAGREQKKRLTRAEVLAAAHDPNNHRYDFCAKCNRPMLKTSIEKHQKNTSVCVEIKSGRIKTLELGRRKDPSIGEFIARQTIFDDNDSSDDEADNVD